MKITLNYSKVNEINYNLLQILYKFDKFSNSCSKNQVIMRMTVEQHEEALEALENGESVNII
jgi:hypothetical protein